MSTLISLLAVVQIPVITAVVGLIGMIVGLLTGVVSFFIILFEVYKIYSGERNRRWGDTYANTIVSWE